MIKQNYLMKIIAVVVVLPKEHHHLQNILQRLVTMNLHYFIDRYSMLPTNNDHGH